MKQLILILSATILIEIVSAQSIDNIHVVHMEERVGNKNTHNYPRFMAVPFTIKGTNLDKLKNIPSNFSISGTFAHRISSVQEDYARLQNNKITAMERS